MLEDINRTLLRVYHTEQSFELFYEKNIVVAEQDTNARASMNVLNMTGEINF